MNLDLDESERGILYTGLIALAEKVSGLDAWDQTWFKREEVHILGLKLRGAPPETIAQLRAGMTVNDALTKISQKAEYK